MKVTRCGDLTLASDLPRYLDEPRIELDADASGAVFLRRQNHDAPVTGPEVVDDVVRAHARELQHRVRHDVTSWREVHVRRSRRALASQSWNGVVADGLTEKQQSCRMLSRATSPIRHVSPRLPCAHRLVRLGEVKIGGLSSHQLSMIIVVRHALSRPGHSITSSNASLCLLHADPKRNVFGYPQSAYATSLNSSPYLATPDTPAMACTSRTRTMNAASRTPSHWLARPRVEAGSNPKRG